MFLWICYSGICRSPTAAKLFGGRYAGYYEGRYYNKKIDKLLEKADIIVVFEDWMKGPIEEQISHLQLKNKRVISWDIPDIYVFDQEELKQILIQDLGKVLSTW